MKIKETHFDLSDYHLKCYSVWGYGSLQHDVKYQPRNAERFDSRENTGCLEEPSPQHEGHDAEHG